MNSAFIGSEIPRIFFHILEIRQPFSGKGQRKKGKLALSAYHFFLFYAFSLKKKTQIGDEQTQQTTRGGGRTTEKSKLTLSTDLPYLLKM